MNPTTHKRASKISLIASGLFLTLVLGLLAYAILARGALLNSINRDPLQLLPREFAKIAPHDWGLVQTANERQSKSVSDKIVFLVSAKDDATREQAKTAVTEQLRQNTQIQPVAALNQSGLQDFLTYYQPHQAAMLTFEQRNKITSQTNEQWQSQIISNAIRPVSIGLSLSDDPLGNLQTWLLAQLDKTKLTPNDNGQLQVSSDGQIYDALVYQTVQSGFDLHDKTPLIQTYNNAKAAAAQIDSSVQIIAAGIPLHAAAATEQAKHEVSVFGTLSMIGIVLLIALAFRSLKAVFMIALSLAIGLGMAFVLTYWAFGQVHLITLVFGVSLTGVAQDYGLHFLAFRQKEAANSVWNVRRHLWIGLFFALLTTVFTYACLAIPPFPGLRQLAFFSVIGLVGSWLTVMLLFPHVFQKLPPESAFSRMFPKWWLRLKQAKLPIMYRKISTALLLILVIFGLSRTSFKDDLRAFQNSPNWLMQEQVKAGKLLGESNTQYFLVTANNEQDLLESEEALRDQLDALNAAGQTFHYRAISEWVPSILRQQANLTLVTDKVAAIAPKIGMDIPTVTSSQISMDSWLAQPFSGALKNQWLGQQADGRWASVVSLTGEVTEKNKQAFAALAKNQPTVLWIDQVENYNQIMQLYRNKMLWMLALAYLVVAACLWPRYRRKSLWVLAAPALASVLTVALLGLLHIPLQLFTVLPLLLILGMGVDYGIFLVEHAKEQQNLWMTVCLSAWSTILSLGTLTLSSTPALHTLGLSLAVGMSATWLAIVFISNWMKSEAA